MLLLACGGFGREESQSSNKRRVDISSRFGLLIIIPIIGESVLIIRTPQDGSNEHIRIGRARVQVMEPVIASDMSRVFVHRWQRGSSVVDVEWILVPESHHVRHFCRVVSKYVIDLLLRDRNELVCCNGGAPARGEAASRG